jgi:hypothetical protein
MKLRGLLSAAFVLAALLGALYWSNRHKTNEDTSVKASPDAAPKILWLNQTDVTRMVIRRKDQPELDVVRSDSGAWQITAPKPLAADKDAVSSVLSLLSPLNSDRLIEEKASDLSRYGLTEPALEVDITLKDNKTQKLLVGDQTPSGSAYYAVLAGDPRLYTIATYNKSGLEKTADDLRDKRLLAADFDKVSQIELIGQKPDKKQDITFAREKDAWQILRPRPYRAETYQVENLIRSLKDAKMESGAADEEAVNAAVFKSAAPFATAKITGASGTQELEIRKAKNDYYARTSVLPGVYKVPSAVGTGLDKSLDDFRNKKIFDFGYQDPNRVEIHDGSKSYFLTRSGSDWWGPDGKKLDDSSVQALLGKLRDLSAEKFPDSGFTTPALEITVTSPDNKRVERVAIAKSGEKYIAKRENEPALYELAASAVSDLEKAAAELKLAPAPTSAPAAKKK